jgi:predicted Zn finger-like uncharacterized protein
MFTQCQHCLTMFRITPEQLMAADGKVRCCRCNNVFDARQNLVEPPVSFVNDSVMQENLSLANTDKKTTSTPGLSNREPYTIGPGVEPGLASDSEIERSLDALADEHPPVEPLSEESILELDEQSSEFDTHSQYLLEQDDGLETEPEYFAAGTESQMSELLDQDSASVLLNEIDTSDRLADVISFNHQDKDSHREIAPDKQPATNEDALAPRDLTPGESDHIFPDDYHYADDESIPSVETLEQRPVSDFSSQEHSAPTSIDATPSQAEDTLDQESRFTFEEEYDQPPPNHHRYYWAIGVFILLLTLGGQTAWYLRDNLVTHDAGRQVLKSICALANCELPIRRDTEQIIISNRTLTTHPDIEDILSLELEIVNTAAFLQPFPKLQLTLYNDMGTVIARRTFEPQEYNADQYGPNQMMPILKAVHIALNLQDPGNDVTGFKFDFL